MTRQLNGLGPNNDTYGKMIMLYRVCEVALHAGFLMAVVVVFGCFAFVKLHLCRSHHSNIGDA